MSNNLQVVKLKNQLHWVGALDPKLRVFDVIMYSESGTTYNSYILEGTKANVLFETVKPPFFKEYLAKLQKTIDLKKINYLVVNHTEPDHAGSVGLLIKHIPNAVVVGTKYAIKYLEQITNSTFPNKVVGDNDEISIGDKTLKFLFVPFLHWPDSMYTYVKEIKTLVTCDSFGAHYSSDKVLLSKLPAKEWKTYQTSLKYYYDCIFGPFGSYVQNALTKIKPLQFDLICPGHGPVLDTKIKEVIAQYKTWSTFKNKNKKKTVVCVYCSAYGYTTSIWNAMKAGIKASKKPIQTKEFDVNIDNFGKIKPQIMEEILHADAVLFGSPTINSDALPLIWDITIWMSPIVHQNKIAAVFGSYGWAPLGVNNIHARLKQLALKVLKPVAINFKPSDADLKELESYGKHLAEAVMTKNIPSAIADKK